MLTLVSNDKHFNVLKSVPFPQINVLKIDEFMAILEQIDWIICYQILVTPRLLWVVDKYTANPKK